MSQALEESSLQAARNAIERNAWHDAFDLYRQAGETHALGPEDLEELANAAWWTGRLEDNLAYRQQAYTGYLETNQPGKAARTAASIARDYMGNLNYSMANGWIGRADRLLENVPESPEHGHLLFLKCFKTFGAGDFEATLQHAQKLLDLGSRFGDRDLQACGLLFEGRVYVALGEVERGLGLLDEATVAAVSGELGPQVTGFVYCMAITSTSSLRDYRRAGEWTEAAKRWCERQSISGFPGHCRVLRAEIMQLKGMWTDAERDIRLALAELKDFNLYLASGGFYELGEIRRRMGDLRGAEQAFAQADELGWEPQPGMALLRLGEGNVAAALGSIKRALADEVGGPLLRFPLLGAQAEIAIAAEDLALAESTVDEMEQIATTYGTSALKASACFALGALQTARSEATEALRTLRQALRLWKDADVPYEVARTRVLLAQAYKEANEPESAQLELQSAAAAFQRLGATLDLRKVNELMGKGTQPVKTTARVTKTFMFTDIVKSTDLVEAMGDEAWGDLMGWHDRTMRSTFLAHGGEEIKQVGDGFFVAFDRPDDAMDCAVAIQRTLADHRRAHGFSPKVRVGLHCGVATRKGSDYEGGQVHLAARVGAMAEGDEILLTTTSCTESSRNYPISGSRLVSLKGIAEPVEVTSVDWR
ncbi:MAG TPA: adenylate/guanylate cyclase domain-containing protein [Actinomycetota bacterium]|nr:adenylate/guanylate cyclase domain-containing protein [Actinomycetota bacterium]